MSYELRIDGIVSALAERKKIQSIEEVRLALAVVANQAVYLWRELKVSLCNVFIIKYGYLVQKHTDFGLLILQLFLQNYI